MFVDDDDYNRWWYICYVSWEIMMIDDDDGWLLLCDCSFCCDCHNDKDKDDDDDVVCMCSLSVSIAILITAYNDL